MSDQPTGCTSVEEWLAAGGKVTRERPSADEPIHDVYDGTEFEWVVQGSAALPATYKCARTGVLAHRRTRNNRITPYVCRHPECDAYGRHRGYGNATYCEEHRPGGES